MLRHDLTRTVLGAVLAAVLLAACCARRRLGRDGRIALDPASDRPAGSLTQPLASDARHRDRGRARRPLAAEQLALDPAISTACSTARVADESPDDHRPAAWARCRSVSRRCPPTASTGIGSASSRRDVRCAAPLLGYAVALRQRRTRSRTRSDCFLERAGGPRLPRALRPRASRASCRDSCRSACR